MTYTDEAKTGVLVKSRTIDDVEYLKRKFAKNPATGLYMAPLKIGVVQEMVNWIKGKEPKRATIENVTTSLRELAQHGAEKYGDNVKILKEACTKAGLSTRFPLWDEFNSQRKIEWREEWYQNQDCGSHYNSKSVSDDRSWVED